MDDIIGRLRRRLTVMTPVETDDGAGGVVRTFEENATVWAAVEPLGGGFRLAAGQGGQAVTHRVILRSDQDLTAQHYLRDGTRTYRIRSVHAGDAERRFLFALVEEMTG